MPFEPINGCIHGHVCHPKAVQLMDESAYSANFCERSFEIASVYLVAEPGNMEIVSRVSPAVNTAGAAGNELSKLSKFKRRLPYFLSLSLAKPGLLLLDLRGSGPLSRPGERPPLAFQLGSSVTM
jgi:hypothetical protein